MKIQLRASEIMGMMMDDIMRDMKKMETQVKVISATSVWLYPYLTIKKPITVGMPTADKIPKNTTMSPIKSTM